MRYVNHKARNKCKTVFNFLTYSEVSKTLPFFDEVTLKHTSTRDAVRALFEEIRIQELHLRICFPCLVEVPVPLGFCYNQIDVSCQEGPNLFTRRLAHPLRNVIPISYTNSAHYRYWLRPTIGSP